jgi:hypothetical protein
MRKGTVDRSSQGNTVMDHTKEPISFSTDVQWLWTPRRHPHRRWEAVQYVPEILRGLCGTQQAGVEVQRSAATLTY